MHFLHRHACQIPCLTRRAPSSTPVSLCSQRRYAVYPKPRAIPVEMWPTASRQLSYLDCTWVFGAAAQRNAHDASLSIHYGAAWTTLHSIQATWFCGRSSVEFPVNIWINGLGCEWDATYNTVKVMHNRQACSVVTDISRDWCRPIGKQAFLFFGDLKQCSYQHAQPLEFYPENLPHLWIGHPRLHQLRLRVHLGMGNGLLPVHCGKHVLRTWLPLEQELW